MKRLLHILLLALALAGLMAPGLRAEGRSGHCARALWAQGQAVTGTPAPVKVSGLAAPLKLVACPDQAIMAEAAIPRLGPRPPVPPQGAVPMPGALVLEAEPPPPKAL
ncbi:MAG: hypothetical protein ABS76_31565 [Pelagibacterium sp. SCN 64-44]|nr:MAG: hypothetical protein ABS76_31565 [Pelagibacterium sp. SCN 64-44]